jgi:mRNA-degrading endonuclease RelE of RelBE toxin-antitoxin system
MSDAPQPPISYQVVISVAAGRMLTSIRKKYGAKVFGMLRDLIRGLASEPQKKGEPLSGVLHGLYSLHYSRYRVIYKISEGRALVLVVAAGWHESGSPSDVYQVIQRMIESGKIVIEDVE